MGAVVSPSKRTKPHWKTGLLPTIKKKEMMFREEPSSPIVIDDTAGEGSKVSRVDDSIKQGSETRCGRADITERRPLQAAIKTASIPIAKDALSEMELARIKETLNRDTQFYNRITRTATRTSGPQSWNGTDILLPGNNFLEATRPVDFYMQSDNFIQPEGGPYIDNPSFEPEDDEEEEGIFEMDLV